MPKIIQSLPYTDGDTLDTDGHNKNIFTTDLSEGIMSVSNGGLDDANLTSDFTVEAQHVAPEAAVRVRADWKMETLDYNSETVASTSDDVNFVPIAGTTARIYLPYSPTLVWWQWSLFVSPWRWRFEHNADETTSNYPARIKAFHVGPDGTETSLDHTRRSIPLSTIVRVDASAHTATNVKARQARNSILYDQAHLLHQPEAGWHEVHVRLYMQYYDRKEKLQPDGALNFAALRDAYFSDRVSIGICNSRVMSLL